MMLWSGVGGSLGVDLCDFLRSDADLSFFAQCEVSATPG